jgi:hypothetical protein
MEINRFFSSSSSVPPSSPDFSQFYQIEVSNAERTDATKLTVRGPDIDGIMASMTLSLAMQGCSLIELHAKKAVDTAASHTVLTDDSIEDVFFVVNRQTGTPFSDDALEPLAQALLKSLSTPMNVLSGGDGPEKTWESLLKKHPPVDAMRDPQITVVKGK